VKSRLTSANSVSSRARRRQTGPLREPAKVVWDGKRKDDGPHGNGWVYNRQLPGNWNGDPGQKGIVAQRLSVVTPAKEIGT
jgi:hypothetical protein